MFFWISPVVWAVPVITPSTATVFVGGNTVQFSAAPDVVTWSLKAGSTGTISAGGLYTSPTSIPAKNVMDGCPVLPNDHIFNTRIDNLPVDSNSTNRINNVASPSSTYIQFEVDFPRNVMNSNTATTAMTFLYTPNNNANFPILSFPYRGTENGAISDDFNDDHHILGVSTTTCQFYEIYQYKGLGNVGGCPSCNAGSGVQYSGESYALPDTQGGNSGGGVDAAGMYLQPLLMRYSELKSGVIKHAMRFTMSNGYIYSGFLWPAVANTNQCGSLSTCFPYGSRLRLKSSYNISSYSPTTQVILTALKNYGMILADGGATMHLQCMNDVFSDSITFAAIQSEIRFGTIAPLSQFEQVDESSLMVSTAVGQVNLANTYVTPDNYAEVVATKNSDSSTASVRVALQPVTVGTQNTPFPAQAGALSVMAGTPQFQIPFWVKGATTTTVNCTMSPTLGTLSSGCLYTAPAGQTLYSSASVTITPTVDSTNAITFPLAVFPSDGIRIDAGGATGANAPTPPTDAAGNYGPDALGKYWWLDPVGENIPWSKVDMYFPQASWPSTPDIGLAFTARSGAKDGVYSAMVPNGSYLLTMGFASDGSNFGITNSSASIDSQGSVLFSTASLVQTAFTPIVRSYPVSVSNNQFYFAIRDVLSTQGEDINYWSLTPYNVPLAGSEYGVGGGFGKGGLLLR